MANLYYASHHHHVIALKSSYNKELDSLSFAIPCSIRSELGLNSKDGDYRITNTDFMHNVPTLSYAAANIQFERLRCYKLVSDYLNLLTAEARSKVVVNDVVKVVGCDRRTVNECLKEYEEEARKRKQNQAIEAEQRKKAAEQRQKAADEARIFKQKIRNADPAVTDVITELQNKVMKLERELQTALDKNKILEISEDLHLYGLSRRTLTSDEWHRSNPDACHQLFGFETWKQLVIYHKTFFPQIKITNEYVDTKTHITFFEKSLIWLLKVRVKMKHSELGYIFDRSKSSISKYLQDVGPKWKEIGMNLCQLDIYEEFLKVSIPQEFIDADMANVGALNDGKDFKSETVRSNSFFSRAGYSAKVNCSAFRIITWSLPYGLVFLASPLYFARATEGGIVTAMGKNDIVELI